MVDNLAGLFLGAINGLLHFWQPLVFHGCRRISILNNYSSGSRNKNRGCCNQPVGISSAALAGFSGNILFSRTRPCSGTGGVSMTNRVHFIGIGGTGISAIAKVLVEKGWQVSGSDRAASPYTEEMEALGVKVYYGHAAANIEAVDFVVRSSAIPDDNIEVVTALKNDMPVLKRIDFLPHVIGDQACIAVAGTHGKTTTTAMIASILMDAGMDPSFIIGSVSKNLGTNAHAGKGDYFVIEADEYDSMFLGLHPTIAIVTNIEHDHPDCYPTPQVYSKAFVNFLGNLKPRGIILLCADNPGSRAVRFQISANIPVQTYSAYPLLNQNPTSEQQNADYLLITKRRWLVIILRSGSAAFQKRNSPAECWHGGYS